MHLPPLLICPFIERRILLFLFWGLKCLILLHVLPCLLLSNSNIVSSRLFFFLFFFPPSFFPFPLSLVSLSPFLLFCFLCHGSGPFCDRILFRNLIFSSSPIFFDFAAPLRFLNLDVASGSQFGMRTWFKFILYFKPSHSLLSPLVGDTMSYSSHAFQKLIITSFFFFFFHLFNLFRILYPFTHTSSQPHSRPLPRKTSLPNNPPRPGRLRHRILIQTPPFNPRHARLSRTYCLRRRKSKRDRYPDLPDRSRRAG